MDPDELIPTRRSLLDRLGDWEDQTSWQTFFDTYWRLIFRVAMKAGLTESEAEEVVQETVLTVAKTMEKYRYEPDRCRFKTWLLRITRMRIVDQFRKRIPVVEAQSGSRNHGRQSSAVEQISDPASLDDEAAWDEEWERNILAVAMDRIKKRIDPVHYQIFYLTTVKEMAARRVAETLMVNRAQVYLCKHRVMRLVKNEMRRIECEEERRIQ